MVHATVTWVRSRKNFLNACGRVENPRWHTLAMMCHINTHFTFLFFLDVIKKIASEAILFRSFWIGTRMVLNLIPKMINTKKKKNYVFNNWLSGWRGEKKNMSTVPGRRDSRFPKTTPGLPQEENTSKTRGGLRVFCGYIYLIEPTGKLESEHVWAFFTKKNGRWSSQWYVMEQWLFLECLTVGDPKNLRFIVCFKQKCFGDLALAGAHTYIVGPTHLGSPWWIGRSRWKPRLGWYLVIPTAAWLSSTFQKLQWKVGSLKITNFTWCTQQSRKLMSFSCFWHKLVQMEQRLADWHLALSNAVSIGQLKCFGKEFLIVTIDLMEKHGSTQVATR